jgi:hypothetical protein
MARRAAGTRDCDNYYRTDPSTTLNPDGAGGVDEPWVTVTTTPLMVTVALRAAAPVFGLMV